MENGLTLALQVAYVFIVGYGVIWREKEKYVTKLWPQTWPERIKRFARKRDFDWRTGVKVFAVFVGAIVALRFALPLLNHFAGEVTGVAPATSGNEAEQIYRISPYLLLVVGVVSPIFEEYMVRATLYDYLRDNWHHVGAVLLSSLVFGVFHIFREGFGWTCFFGPFFAGLLLCLVYDRAGFGGAVLVHSGNNFLAWLLVFL